MFIRTKRLPQPNPIDNAKHTSLPPELAQIKEEHEITFDIVQQAKFHFQLQVVPLIEGSTLSESELRTKIKEAYAAIEFPSIIKDCMFEDPWDLIEPNISKQENITAQTRSKLLMLDDAQANPEDQQMILNIPACTWSVNRSELLAAHFNNADVKQCRKSRKTFMTKITLYVDLISAIEHEDAIYDRSDTELSAIFEKIKKIENEEMI